ncbi:MAG: DNA-3-methyladenine glycosylase I [Armatimonadetes bacterium]|nr:DNA-3-methyladenine glycosylase I [Armatimonadota bacterium]
MKRCTWAVSEAMIAYHDDEWGTPLHDDRALFAEELSRRIVEQCRVAGLEVRTALKSEDR